MGGTLFDAVGGLPVITALAHAWHTRCLADEVVAHAFSHGFHPDHSARLADYWAEAWGGPASYSATVGDQSFVLRLHSGNGEHEEMDRRALDCFVAAVAETVPEDSALRQALVDYFAWGIGQMNAYPDPDTEVPAGLSVPRWDVSGPHQ